MVVRAIGVLFFGFEIENWDDAKRYACFAPGADWEKIFELSQGVASPDTDDESLKYEYYKTVAKLHKDRICDIDEVGYPFRPRKIIYARASLKGAPLHESVQLKSLKSDKT